jgi:hypothetical protein
MRYPAWDILNDSPIYTEVSPMSFPGEDDAAKAKAASSYKKSALKNFRALVRLNR